MGTYRTGENMNKVKRDYSKSLKGTQDDSQLMRKIAEEFNDVMKLTPPIRSNPGREGDLVYKDIVDESKEIDLSKDDGKFSSDVVAFLKQEGLWPGSEKIKKDVEHLVDKTKPIEKGENKVGTKTAKKKKAVKKSKKKAAKKKAAKKSVEKKTSKPKSTYTRSHALVAALKKGGTRKVIIELSNSLYVEKGGENKINIATNCFSLSMPVLILLNVMEKENNIYKLKR